MCSVPYIINLFVFLKSIAFVHAGREVMDQTPKGVRKHGLGRRVSNMRQQQQQSHARDWIDNFSCCGRRDDENAHTAACILPPSLPTLLCELSQMIYCCTYASPRLAIIRGKFKGKRDKHGSFLFLPNLSHLRSLENSTFF